MFSKMTIILEKSSLIACFGLAIAICGLFLLKKAVITLEKTNKRHSFALSLVSIPVITLGLMTILHNEKITPILLYWSEYLISLAYC